MADGSLRTTSMVTAGAEDESVEFAPEMITQG